MSPKRAARQEARKEQFRKLDEAVSKYAERGYDGRYQFDIRCKSVQDPELCRLPVPATTGGDR
jgi:hypothetical protein